MITPFPIPPFFGGGVGALVCGSGVSCFGSGAPNVVDCNGVSGAFSSGGVMGAIGVGGGRMGSSGGGATRGAGVDSLGSFSALGGSVVCGALVGSMGVGGGSGGGDPADVEGTGFAAEFICC
ncbi:hypothetical protein HYV22_02325 [Candidatus Gottesmanbacteria bacterium]|nr:hypothetical protein [Candidatus Gottesmanbacteria bacterium]